MILVCLCILLIAGACAVESPNVQSGKVDYNPNPQYSPAELDQLAMAHNQFALDLYRLLAKDEENLVYSPYSLFQALMMIYAGAEGETASHFEQVFHLAAKNPEVHALMNALNRMLGKKRKPAGRKAHHARNHQRSLAETGLSASGQLPESAVRTLRGRTALAGLRERAKSG